MDSLIKLSEQLICFAACMLLGVFLTDIYSISLALAALSFIVLIPCIVYIVIQCAFFRKFKQVKLQLKESNFFWAGYYLLVSIVLLGRNHCVWAAVSGFLSLLHFVPIVYTVPLFTQKKKQ